MIHDLVTFSKALEVYLVNTTETMQLLKPKFTLVGSIPEGTRIGIGNELDITIDFEGWKDNPPLMTSGDSVYLYREVSWSNCHFLTKLTNTLYLE